MSETDEVTTLIKVSDESEYQTEPGMEILAAGDRVEVYTECCGCCTRLTPEHMDELTEAWRRFRHGQR